MVGCFVFRPLRNTVIYRSFMCLVSFSILHLDLSGSSQSDPTSVFLDLTSTLYLFAKTILCVLGIFSANRRYLGLIAFRSLLSCLSRKIFVLTPISSVQVALGS
jgi:hypothetical protein